MRSGSTPTPPDGAIEGASQPYFAVVLDDRSHAALARLSRCVLVVAHHMTVVYGTSRAADLPARFTGADLGREYELVATRIVLRSDGHLQAAAVGLVLPDGHVVTDGISVNAVPHVTIALTPGMAAARDSNALLESTPERPDQRCSLRLRGRLERVDP
ncbi:MAG: hypothetical protein IV100_19790 [Myxococcales bacterium]|nr:hypothetical protein [Myxococcales bacterium]